MTKRKQARGVGACLWIVAMAGCAHRPATQTPPDTPAADSPTADAPAAPQAEDAVTAPRLVLSVVFDQLGSDTLARHLPLLSEDGAIKDAIARGFYAERVRYTHATSLTAPNHAAIYTGVVPVRSGITGNLLRRASGEARTSVDDGRHRVLGRPPGAFAGPDALRAPTVGDVLRHDTDNRAKVVSLSIKDRAAILPGGHKANIAVWYDESVPGFTTSTYYADALPEWLTDFTRRTSIETLMMPWTPLSAAALSDHLGPDAEPGEGKYLGWGTTFPHNPRKSKQPNAVLRLTPALSEALIDLAGAAVDAYALGEDDAPDLLALSISGVDYTGHVFGPDSWEYVDHLIRADRALGALVRRLSQHTAVALVITSDHGVARLPERASKPMADARVTGQTLMRAAERAIKQDLGGQLGRPGPWIERFAAPYMYLTEAARTHPRRQEIVAAAIKGLAAAPHTHAAYDVQALLQHAATPEERDVAAALHPRASGEIYVVHEPGSMSDIGMVTGAGTTHGSPWDYDRQVPGIFAGPGIPSGRESQPVDQPRLTSTLAKLVGVTPPDPDAPPPLF